MKESLLKIDDNSTESSFLGEIKEVTSNYMLTKKENQVIIYSLSGQSVREVFRETFSDKIGFNKSEKVKGYD